MSLQVRVPLHVPRSFNLHPCKSFFNNNLHFFRILKIWVCFQYYTSGGNTSVQDERFLENFQSSPKYKKEPGGFLYDEDLPTHATFLRNEDGEGSFGEQQIITIFADWAETVYAADFDDDGDMDVLSASREDDKIAWYRNEDGEGSFGEQNIITNEANGASK